MDPTFLDRITRLRSSLENSSIEARWVDPSLDMTYLTGLSPISMERIMGLVVVPDGPLRLVVPKMLADEAAHLPDCESFEWDDSEGPEAALKGALDGLSKLHVSPTLPIGAVEAIRSARSIDVDIEDEVLADLRSRKDETEAESLRKASHVTDEMVRWVDSISVVGLTERQLSLKMAMRYLEQGHRPWDDLLVAYGANASMPHYTGDVPIGSGEALLIDIGAVVDGYQSDTTRMFFPENEDPEVMSAYDVILEAAEAAFAAVGAGVPAQEVDRAARKVITANGFGELFIHRTGHGVGLDVHEPPYLREGNETPLEVGNVFSIEPGIYKPGRFGVRYENLVYIGPQGAELLNHTPSHHRL